MTEENVLTHKGCGGRLVLNAAPLFLFLTPNLSFTSEGINIGPLELQTTDVKSSPSFVCATCSEKINLPEDEDKIEVRCAVCREKNPVKDMYVTKYISAVCSSCKGHMTKESKASAPENVQRVLKYLDISGSDMKFTMLSTVFKKPVRL